MNILMDFYDGGEGTEHGKVICGIGEKYCLKCHKIIKLRSLFE